MKTKIKTNHTHAHTHPQMLQNVLPVGELRTVCRQQNLHTHKSKHTSPAREGCNRGGQYRQGEEQLLSCAIAVRMTTLLVPERLLNVATKIVQRPTPTMPFPLALVAATTMSAVAAVVVVRSADHSRTGMPLDLRRHRSNTQSAPSYQSSLSGLHNSDDV